MYGLDFLGGTKYEHEAIAGLPHGWAAGIFLREFGDGFDLIEPLAHGGNCPAIRTHILWDKSHKYSAKLNKLVFEEAAKLNAVAAKYPSVKFYVSPYCEHNKPGSEIGPILKKLQHDCPHLTPVNSIWKGDIVKDYISEVHGDAKAPPGDFLWSADGDDLPQIDSAKEVSAYGRALIRFGWGQRFNLRQQEDLKKDPPLLNLPPMKRTAKPSVEYIHSVARLVQPPGTAPEFPHAHPLTHFTGQKSIMKSHAEDKVGNNDPRANKLMAIFSEHAPEVDVYDCENNHIEQMRFYGPYSGGGFRYYSSFYGYQLGEKAKKQTGSEWVVFKVAHQFYGPVNPAFRTAPFH